MKKTNKIFGLATMLLTVAGMVACGSNKPAASSGPCKHSWKVDEEASVAATCATEGKKVQKCELCGETKETKVNKTAHQYEEVAADSRAATCEDDGVSTQKCKVCGDVKTTTIPALDHEWERGSDQAAARTPTCTEPGWEVQACKRCGDTRLFDLPAAGHTFADGGKTTEKAGDYVAFTESVCDIDNAVRYSWSAGDVTADCAANPHNVVSANNGFQFWGQPVGNAVVLNDSGNATSDAHEAVPDATVKGSYFEFKFNSPAAYEGVELVADINPAQYLNDTDMFKAPANPAQSDWTYGINPDGTPITDFRYIILLNDAKVELDATVNTPGAGRKWYTFPTKGLDLVKGENTIKIVMAGGWKHTFFSFGLETGPREAVEPFTVEIDADAGATVKVFTSETAEVEDTQKPYVTRNKDTGEPSGEAEAAQFYFTVTLDDPSKSVEVSVVEGKYNKLSLPSSTVPTYKVTKIASNLKIKVAVISEVHGYNITFVKGEHVISITPYIDQTYTTVDTNNPLETRSDVGEITRTGTSGQAKFKVICEDGYEAVVTAKVPTAQNGKAGYGNIKSPEEVGIENCWRITKIEGDIVITVNAKLIGA